MWSVLNDEVAHDVIEILQQTLRVEGEFRFRNGFDGIRGKEQVEERHYQCE